MTIEKAKLILENEMPSCGRKITFTSEERYEAYQVGIQAVEKQIPKSVLLPESGTGSQRYCPMCGACVGSVVSILKSREFGLATYCNACGQSLRSD